MSQREALDLALLPRAAGSYFSAPGESLWGGVYGGDAVVAMNDALGFLGTVHANHLSGGTQFAASLGLIRVNDLDCCDPWSFSVVWDQFTDSRIEGLYLTQLRAQVGYSLTQRIEAGALYTTPTNRDHDTPYTFTFLGTDFTEFGTAAQSETIVGYLAGRLARGVQYGVAAGYREDPNSMLAAISLRAPINDRVSVFAGGTYADRFAVWGAGLGLEVRLGPRSPSACCGCAWSEPAETRHVRPVSYVPPGGELPQPPAGKELPFEELTGAAATEAPAIFFRSRLTDRVLESNHKLIYDLFSQPAAMWAGCGGDTDRNPFFRNRANIELFDVRFGQPGRSGRLFFGEAQ